MPSELERTLQRHRRRLIEREEAAFRELLEAYEVIERDLRRQFRELQRRIREAQAAGEEISPSWFGRERRLKSLIDQVKQQIERFGGTASRITTAEQRAAIRIAGEQTEEVFRVLSSASVRSLGSTLPTRVVEDAVGMMGDGSPILEYYREQLAPKVAEMIRVEVIKAAATGTDFNTIARRLMRTGQITRSRALMVARTEVNRVRREATRQSYIDSGVTTHWEWVASLSPRTCPACLALDGRRFKLEDPFPQHPNCRCTMIPVIEGVEMPPRETGKEWFDRQPDEIKEMILGKEGLAAYKEGIVSLDDFVGWKNDKQFGRSVYTKPLSVVLADKPIAEPLVRTPRIKAIEFEFGTKDMIEDILGTPLSGDEIGGLVGALDGAEIAVEEWGEGLRFVISHPLISQQVRTLDTDWAGRVFIHNEIFRTSRTAPRGTGLKSFATQVFHAERFGVAYIDTEAVGNYASSRSAFRWNGYYSWARMGYNAPLDENDWDLFPETYRGIPDINSLMEQTNGRFVWLYYGSGRDMIFDLDRESASWRILNKYLQKRGFRVEFE